MKKLLLLTCLFALACTSAAAAKETAGSLDPSFGRSGKVIMPMQLGYPWDWEATPIAGLPHGRLVLLADTALLAFSHDGSRASDFNGGRVQLPTPGFGYDLVADRAGRIVVGWTEASGSPPGFAFGDQDVRLARYGSGGELDASFGNGGSVRMDFGSAFEATGNLKGLKAPAISTFGGLASDHDGGILVSGLGVNQIAECKSYIPSGDAYMARLLDDGSLDSGFAEGGLARIPVSADVESPTVTASGGLYLLTSSGDGCDSGPAPLARFDAGGNRDQSFSQEATFSSNRLGSHLVAVDRHERVLVAQEGVHRILPDGQIDKAFGIGGVAHLPAPPGFTFVPRALAIEGSGKIVVVGTARSSRSGTSLRRFMVVRLTQKGTLDPTFGRGGRVITRFGRHSQAAAANLELVPGGIVVAGTVSRPSSAGGQGIVIVRYSR